MGGFDMVGLLEALIVIVGVMSLMLLLAFCVLLVRKPPHQRGGEEDKRSPSR